MRQPLVAPVGLALLVVLAVVVLLSLNQGKPRASANLNRQFFGGGLGKLMNLMESRRASGLQNGID
jgi:hypothetical protein